MNSYIKSVNHILKNKTDAEKVEWLIKSIDRIRNSTNNKLIDMRERYNKKLSEEYNQAEIKELKAEIEKLRIKNRIYKKLIYDFGLEHRRKIYET